MRQATSLHLGAVIRSEEFLPLESHLLRHDITNTLAQFLSFFPASGDNPNLVTGIHEVELVQGLFQQSGGATRLTGPVYEFLTDDEA